ncbi:MAG: signal peptidase I [Candidatus Levybacteria bacterium]|nr:signal peptidase I [Candidatus Levybacteria bacterium]
MKSIFKVINLTIAGVLIAVAIGVAYIALPFFGNQALIVRSGSMSPAIDVGSVAVVSAKQNLLPFSKPAIAQVYKTGDVIAFRSEKNKEIIVTHRIVNVITENNKTLYRTQGDANDDPDAGLVKSENVLGKANIVIPYVGKVLAFAKSDIGFPALILFPAVLVILFETWSIIKEIRKRKQLNDRFGFVNFDLRKKNKVSFFGLRVLIPLLIFSLFIPSTIAFFSDSETSTGNVFQAAENFPPQTDHLVISEVQIDGGIAQNKDNDFIELYNPTSSPINLEGYRLVKRTGNSPNDTNIITFTSSHIIPAHDYFLWAHVSGGQNPNNFGINIGADVTSSDTLSASNSVAIRFGDLNTGTIVDALSWDPGASSLKEGSQFPSNPSANQSMERKAYSTSTQATMEGGADASKGNGFDSNDNSVDFILRLVSQPQNSSSTPEIP